MNAEITEKYESWLKNAKADDDLIKQLISYGGDEEQITDAFYRELEFGTGGLRGVIGAGTNRMNVYTVAKASKGLADYILKNNHSGAPKIAVSYDSRIKSQLFARVACGVFAENGIKVYLYSELMPTPCLSFAVRKLQCDGGIMITASHNPSKYNGYKVYGADGCQITTEAADAISALIAKAPVFDVAWANFESALASKAIEYIDGSVYTAFIEEVKKQSVLEKGDKTDKNAAIIYSPLNGTGLKPVLRALKESGFNNVTVVKEQEQPDGNFPTCPYPNPEIKEAMALGMSYAQQNDADLLIATDPDCDRAGIAVKDDQGKFVLLSGNETGMLLFDYICSMRKKAGKMPKNPVLIKTIVTIDMAEKIAENYGVETINVLTGFKFIGEQIGRLENIGRASDYIFGFEESYGYLSGTYVRDKDAVDAAFLICEMYAYYAAKNVTLYDKLQSLYKQYGFCLNTLHSFEFDGQSGFEKMKGIMNDFRGGYQTLADVKVIKTIDYSKGVDGLPKSDVIKFYLEGGCSVVVRPSGTEPKLKIYLSVSSGTREDAVKKEKSLADYFISALNSPC